MSFLRLKDSYFKQTLKQTVWPQRQADHFISFSTKERMTASNGGGHVAV
jgi:hypothetical protein